METSLTSKSTLIWMQMDFHHQILESREAVLTLHVTMEIHLTTLASLPKKAHSLVNVSMQPVEETDVKITFAEFWEAHGPMTSNSQLIVEPSSDQTVQTRTLVPMTSVTVLGFHLIHLPFVAFAQISTKPDNVMTETSVPLTTVTAMILPLILANTTCTTTDMSEEISAETEPDVTEFNVL